MANLDKEECSNMLSECGLAVALTVSSNCLTFVVAYCEKYDLPNMLLLRYYHYHSFKSLWLSSNS